MEPFKWDGLFQRGFGRSRCIPLPKSCGQPGEVCCASMMDQRISGLVHNRLFPYQPCNYRAAGRTGMFCKGQWQGGLLNSDAVLGVCTLNPDDCGKVRRLRGAGATPARGTRLGEHARPGVFRRLLATLPACVWPGQQRPALLPPEWQPLTPHCTSVPTSLKCLQPGRPCCVNDIPEVGGAVGTCSAAERQHYCSKKSERGCGCG